MAIAGRTSDSFQSENTTPHEGLKNVLDLAEVISELKAVIVQQNKLLEQLSKNATSTCVFINGQHPQPQQRPMLFGNPEYGRPSPPPGFMFNGSFNGPSNNQYPNQTPVQPNVDVLPIWYKPYVPIHCLMVWADSGKDLPSNFRLALVNGTVYKVPPVVVCHYKSMVEQSPEWGAHLAANLCKDTSGPWGRLTIDMFGLPAGTMVHRNSGHNEDGILYRIPGFQYPGPVSEKSWF